MLNQPFATKTPKLFSQGR